MSKLSGWCLVGDVEHCAYAQCPNDAEGHQSKRVQASGTPQSGAAAPGGDEVPAAPPVAA